MASRDAVCQPLCLQNEQTAPQGGALPRTYRVASIGKQEF
jgi:hypothetical protein